MFRDEKLELKVGLFIGLGIFLMFFLVFSISDLYILEKGYNINVIFDFVNGITEDAPVRLAGVHVGEVKAMDIFYDDESKKTRVKLDVWIKGDIKVERDAVASINTLGLLGEQYLEITPGSTDRFLKEGESIVGRNPINVSMQMERMSGFIESATNIIQRVEKGEGTLGKLLVDQTLYDDISTIFARIKDGEGTVGKFLTDDAVYNNIEEFTADIKAHPWKLLSKPSGSRRRSEEEDEKRGTSISPR